MTLNEKKSAILFIKKIGEKSTQNYEIPIEKIPIVKNYKYLGV